MTDPNGNNAPDTTTPPMDASLESLATMGSAEIAKLFGASDGVNATNVSQVQDPAPPPAAPAPASAAPAQPENKAEIPEQFRKADGSLDEERLQKSTQHLEQALNQKEDALKKYKELQDSFRQKSVQVKEEQQRLGPLMLPPPAAPSEDLSPEFREQLKVDYERDPVGTMLRLQEAFARRERETFRQHQEAETQAKREDGFAHRREELASKPGQEWILSETGAQRFSAVFEEHPYLWQSKDPYGAALRFMENAPAVSATNPGVTQAGPRTPILGGGRTVPPPASAGPVTAERSLEQSGQLVSGGVLRDKRAMTDLSKKLEQEAAQYWEKTLGS